MSVCRQMCHDTNKIPSVIASPYPPTAYFWMFARSGLHRLSRSGLGLPNKAFMPSVKRKALAMASASPIQPVFHSQSLRRHINDLGVPLPKVGPGTKRRLTKKMMTAGTTRETITSTVVEMVSFTLKGKEMLASTGENGRRFGEILVNRAPTIAMSL